MASSLEGQIIDGREIVRPLGTGAKGEVWLARDQRTRDLLALKILSARPTIDPATLVKLRSPYVVPVLAHGVMPDGRVYLALEFIAGKSLVEVGVTNLADGIQILSRVASALEAAHAQKLAHGDLKPSNVLLHYADPKKPRVSDFGLGKPGTPAEDVLAFAQLTHLVLTGKPAFGERLSVRGPELAIPKILDNLIFACLTPDPAHRPSADELAAHLANLANRPTKPDFGMGALNTIKPTEDLGQMLGEGGGGAQLGTILGELADALDTLDPGLSSLRKQLDGYAAQETAVEIELAALDAQLEDTTAPDKRAPIQKKRGDVASRKEQLAVVVRMMKADLARRVAALRAQAPESLRQLYAEFDAATRS